MLLTRNHIFSRSISFELILVKLRIIMFNNLFKPEMLWKTLIYLSIYNFSK